MLQGTSGAVAQIVKSDPNLKSFKLQIASPAVIP